MKKIAYITKFSKNDVGPKSHVQAVIKYSAHQILSITSTSLSPLNEILIKDTTSISSINSIIFQLRSFSHVWANRNEIDFVLLRLSMGFFVLPILIRLIRLPLILEVNGLLVQDAIDRKGILRKIYALASEKIAIKCSTTVVCVHKNIMKSLTRDHQGYRYSKYFVIENGYHPVKMPFAKNNSNLVKIGYLGSYAMREGTDILPRISRNLLNKKFPHKFILVGGTEEDIKDHVKLCDEYKVSSNFEWYSNRALEEALTLINDVDVAIHLRLPIRGVTNSQGSPLKILDYLNLGKYLLVSNLESYKFIEENKLGVMISLNGDMAEDAANALLAIKNNHSNMEQCARAKEFVVKRSWPNQLKKLDSLIDAL